MSEAWREGNVEYATVAMRYSAIDVMVDRTSGAVVEGNPNEPVESVELWTFTRDRWRRVATRRYSRARNKSFFSTRSPVARPGFFLLSPGADVFGRCPRLLRSKALALLDQLDGYAVRDLMKAIWRRAAGD